MKNIEKCSGNSNTCVTASQIDLWGKKIILNDFPPDFGNAWVDKGRPLVALDYYSTSLCCTIISVLALYCMVTTTLETSILCAWFKWLYWFLSVCLSPCLKEMFVNRAFFFFVKISQLKSLIKRKMHTVDKSSRIISAIKIMLTTQVFLYDSEAFIPKTIK